MEYQGRFNNDYISNDGESYITKYSLNNMDKKLPLRVLSQSDWIHWKEYGFVIVKDAITKGHAESILDTACDFQGVDRNNLDSFYQEKHFDNDLEQQLHIYGFIEMYQHQLLWDARQNERVYNAFVDIWDTEELWTTLDRVNVNPPNVRNRSRSLIPQTDRGFDISLHWDVETTNRYKPQRVQGIIALNDFTDEVGGFQCSPSLFSQYDEWVKTQPDNRDPVRPTIDTDEYPIIIPKLSAGDLLIFNGWLAHGVGPNSSDKDIRACQYLSMMPALNHNEKLRESRIESWKSLKTPCWNSTLIGDKYKHESERYNKATLTPLGEKLLGLKTWEAGL
ncbi:MULTISPECIES: phytanoyl-CoA dioxygenase family protein [Vibrio]|uniref:phytanoyl-CoA dioxygenase family protein n=1 Tax=Vibrio TaxID=662 RepID=UPI003D10A542